MKIVHLDIIENNIKKYKEFYAVVKNNCYGLGIEVVKLLIKNGIKKFCVNTLEEALKLRRLNKKIYILLLSDFDVDKIKIYKKNKITLTLSSIEKRKYLKNINYEIKLNLGLNRYGLDLKDYFYDCTKRYYTHLPNNFNLDLLKNYKIDHAFTSNRANLNAQLYRLGMALYKDCLEVVEKIKNIWFVKKGQSVGYDYIVNEDSYFAVINIGYYNGLISQNKGRNVYINNRYYKIVSISMNHTFIEVDEFVKINDFVEIIGKNITIDYLKSHLNLLEYEIFTMIHDKIIYKKGN